MESPLATNSNGKIKLKKEYINYATNMVTILMWTTGAMLEVQHVINHIHGKDVCNLFLYL